MAQRRIRLDTSIDVGRFSTPGVSCARCGMPYPPYRLVFQGGHYRCRKCFRRLGKEDLDALQPDNPSAVNLAVFGNVSARGFRGYGPPDIDRARHIARTDEAVTDEDVTE